MFHYNCTIVDTNELRFWVFNNDLIVNAPAQYREDLVFIDSGKLIKCLKKEYINMGFIPSQKISPGS